MSAEITKETVTDFAHSWVTVGAVNPVAVVGIDRLAYKGVLLYCPGAADVEGSSVANTVPVYVGGPKVQAGQVDGGGMPIAPGRSIVIPIERPFTLYALASTGGQRLAWMLI